MLKIKKFWIPVAVIIVSSLTMTAQPASAASSFDAALSEAASQHANGAYGAPAAWSLWVPGSQTLLAVTPAAGQAVDKTLPTTEAAQNKLIADNTNLLAGFVTNVTGYDPRLPDQMAHLQGALRDYWAMLNTQKISGDHGLERYYFATLEYREYHLVNGHDEFRRKLLGFRCNNCAREIAFAAAGGGVGLIYNVVVNGNNIKAIISSSVGAGTGFLIGAIVAYLSNAAYYKAMQAAQLDRNSRSRLAEMSTLALVTAREALAAAHLNAVEMGQKLDVLQRQVDAGSTFVGRVRWLISGHQQ